jgi:hypothetical protein
MNKLWACLVVVLLLTLRIDADATPTQVHLSLTGAQDEMTFTWMTDDDADTIVYYWTGNSQKQSVTGTSSRYYLPLPPYQSPSIHCNFKKLFINFRCNRHWIGTRYNVCFYHP